MKEDNILDYNQMIESAFRGVPREAVSRVAAHGLPGKHHFYITFITDCPGVQIPAYLRERYPGEMTIVLQHQFSDLTADADKMGVTLFFNAKPERLIIPWRAITIFADRSVNFALQFKTPEEQNGSPSNPAAGLSENEEMAEAEENQTDSGRDSSGGQVISLDNFRKKE